MAKDEQQPDWRARGLPMRVESVYFHLSVNFKKSAQAQSPKTSVRAQDFGGDGKLDVTAHVFGLECHGELIPWANVTQVRL